MKEFEFKALNELTTPDSWVEKALAIPEAEEKRRPAVTARRIRYVALAASFVLVGALAVILFTNKATEPPVISAPAVVQTATENTVQPTVPTAQPTEPTEKATQKHTQKPTVAPTQRSTQSISSPTQPVDQGSPAPVQASNDAPPTDAAVTPTQPATVPAAPTQQPTAAPTEPPTTFTPDKPDDIVPVGYDGIIIETIPVEDVGDGSVIYCRICTEDGTPLDDGDPYSDERRAQTFEDDGEIMIYYVPYDCVTLPGAGTYRFEFYDETGKILCSGSEYLMP